MTEFAAVVLAHADAPQVRRLIAALEDVPVVLHCDAATAPRVAADMLRDLPARVTVLERRRTTLASWSLVAAELAGLRAAIARSDARHIAVLSGSDYPLLPVQDLVAELEAWDGRTWCWNRRMPFQPWSTSRHPDGGMWRLRRRFLVRQDQLVFLAGVPLRWPLLRPALPDGIEPRASAQWKIYSRAHAERLLRIVDDRPDLVRFWRSTLVPEETFVASVLGSPGLLGHDALPPCTTHAWYMEWGGEGHEHPVWLGPDSFERLIAARSAEPAGPDLAFAPWNGQQRPSRKLFARKVSSAASAELLDRIDAELGVVGDPS